MKLKADRLEGDWALHENTKTPIWNACCDQADPIRGDVVRQVLQTIALQFTIITNSLETRVFNETRYER